MCETMTKTDFVCVRNRVLIARYWYYTECKRIRFDDVLSRLSKHEFFISERTIMNILRENDSYYNMLLQKNPGRKYLTSEYPGWSWQ